MKDENAGNANMGMVPSTKDLLHGIVKESIDELNEQECDVSRMQDDMDHVEDVVVAVMVDMGIDLSTEVGEKLRDEAKDSIGIVSQHYVRSDESTIDEDAVTLAHHVAEKLLREHKSEFASLAGWHMHKEAVLGINDKYYCIKCWLIEQAERIVTKIKEAV